jgi:hypothetical protein
MSCNRALLLLASGVSLGIGARVRSQSTTEGGDCYSPYDGKALLEVRSFSEADAESLKEVLRAASCVEMDDEGISSLGRSDRAAERVICSGMGAEYLMEKFKANVKIVSDDAGSHLRATGSQTEKFVESRAGRLSSSFYNSFRNLDDQEERVRQAVSASGGAATLEKVGTSIEGRSIMGVRIRGSGYKKGGPRVVLSFNVHAREWVAGMSGCYVVEKLTERAKNNPSYFKGVEVFIIPMGNPDGFDFSVKNDRMWRKNKRNTGSFFCDGVDINRNFPLGWGGPYSTSTSKCSDVYIGSKAASEPESQAIIAVLDEAPVSVYIDVHCYGRYILKPWSYTNDPHPRASEVDDLGKKMLKAVKSSRNNRFQYGGNELLGRASGVCPDYANGGLGYTYELTTAFDPPASEILPSGIEALDGVSAAIEWSR